MTKNVRHTVISLRVTTDEHDRLCAVAAARKMSISDLIRSLIDRETAPPVATRTTSSPASVLGVRSVFIDHDGDTGTGFFWQQMDGTTTEGTTLTLSARHPPARVQP